MSAHLMKWLVNRVTVSLPYVSVSNKRPPTLLKSRRYKSRLKGLHNAAFICSGLTLFKIWWAFPLEKYFCSSRRKYTKNVTFQHVFPCDLSGNYLLLLLINSKRTHFRTRILSRFTWWSIVICCNNNVLTLKYIFESWNNCQLAV